MRQVGVIAAAGIVALETMVHRLAEDHANAHRLAEGLAQIRGIRIDPYRVQTNIVFFEVEDRPAKELVAALAEQGIQCLTLGHRVRMVTHYHITPQDVERTLQAVNQVMQAGSRAA